MKGFGILRLDFLAKIKKDDGSFEMVSIEVQKAEKDTEIVRFRRYLSRLYDTEVIPLIKKVLCAAVYTQISDVEEEINGVFTYDREIVKLEEDVVRELNQKLYDEYEKLTK